jgi:hypothetical protein
MLVVCSDALTPPPRAILRLSHVPQRPHPQAQGRVILSRIRGLDSGGSVGIGQVLDFALLAILFQGAGKRK